MFRKHRSAMLQNRLEALLTVSIDQESEDNINMT